jgi:diacylglycerol kinase
MRELGRSLYCAVKGIAYSISKGRNMKIHLLAAILVTIMGFVLEISRIEWAIIVLTIFMVLAAETINSAIEGTVDLVTKDHHPLAGLAKDLAAGGVLLTAINAVIMALLIFGPRLMAGFRAL